MLPAEAAEALTLYATVVAHLPLMPDEWQDVPSSCLGLGTALPAVLHRSAAEAAQLVRHLPSADRERMCTATLCLARAQRVYGVELPADIVVPLLVNAVAG